MPRCCYRFAVVGVAGYQKRVDLVSWARRLYRPKVFSDAELKALDFTLAGSSLIKENLAEFMCQADLTKKLVCV